MFFQASQRKFQTPLNKARISGKFLGLVVNKVKNPQKPFPRVLTELNFIPTKLKNFRV
jgi:hypothetical protein